MDEQEDYVTDASEVLKETGNTLKELVEKQIISKEVATRAADDLVMLEKNYEEMLDGDFEVARQNINVLITKSMATVNSLLVVAASSDHAGTYEVAALFVKTLSEMNMMMLELHEKHEKARTARGSKKESPSVVNNTAIFTGTPQALLKFLAQQTKSP